MEVLRSFKYTRTDGLTTHAMRWVTNAKYLVPPIEQHDLVSTIIQHYPTSLSMAIRGRGPQNTVDLLRILTKFEEGTSFCEEQLSHPNRNYRTDNNNRTYNHNNNRQNNNHQSYQPRGPGPIRDNHRSGENNCFQPRNPVTVHPDVRPMNNINVSGNEEASHQ